MLVLDVLALRQTHMSKHLVGHAATLDDFVPIQLFSFFLPFADDIFIMHLARPIWLVGHPVYEE